MKITQEYIKNLPQGATLLLPCENAANLDSVYQVALKGRKAIGLTSNEMRVTRYAKEMKVEVERKPCIA